MIATPNQSGKFPGLSLKAWALFVGSTGAIVKSANVASVTRTLAGQYTVAFSNNMQSVNYLSDCWAEHMVWNSQQYTTAQLSTYGVYGFEVVSKAVGSCVVRSWVSGTRQDQGRCYVAFYE